MRLLPRKELDSVASIYVAANTPMYLYKHLRKDSTVIKLSEKPTPDILKMLLFYIGDQGSKRVEAQVAAYACLVALSFKPRHEFEDIVTSLAAPGMRWLPDLRAFIFAEGAINKLVIDVPAVRLLTNTDTSANNTVAGVPASCIIRGG